jgi:NAD(P)-dependent dehydrogenase (short-subunit alcohol dehydrogenase family)
VKSILITGAGTGIGAATAKELSADPGLRLILVGRRLDKLEEVKSALQNAENHVCLSADVSDAKELEQGLSKIDLANLQLCGVFANAGIGGENTFGKADRWTEILDINLTGTYNTIMLCLPHLVRSQEAITNIVITSSCLAKFGVPNYTAYCTSKAGLLGLTKSLAVEYAPKGVLVNAICPGWVDTEMARAAIQKLADRAAITYEKSLAQQMKFIPTGKMSEPSEIGRLVAFLLTNQQSSITGQSIDINNGAYMN